MKAGRPAGLVAAARRWLYDPPRPTPDDAGRMPLRSVVDGWRRLYREVSEAGGSTIDTPLPGSGPLAVGARTVVQLDGDLICLVDESWADDATLQAHLEGVETWFAGLRAIVVATRAALRTAGLVLGALVGLATGAVAGTLGNASYGMVAFALSLAAAPLFGELARGAVRFAVGRALR